MENCMRLSREGQIRSANVCVRERAAKAHTCLPAFEYVCPLKEPELSFSICRWLTKLISAPRLGGMGGPNLGAWGYVSEMKWGNAEQRIAAKLRARKTMQITAGVNSFIFMSWSSGGRWGGFGWFRELRHSGSPWPEMFGELVEDVGEDSRTCDVSWWEVTGIDPWIHALPGRSIVVWEWLSPYIRVCDRAIFTAVTHTYTHSFWCSATAVQMSPVKSYLWRRENTLLHPQLIY